MKRKTRRREEEEGGVMWSGNKFLAERERDREPGGQREFCVIGIRQTVRQAPVGGDVWMEEK